MLAFLGALAAVGGAYRHRFRHEKPPAVAAVDTWAASGVRYSQEGRGGARLRFTAEALAPMPIRHGVFSLGFMERLEASAVDVQIELGSAPDLADLELDLRSALTSITSSQGQGKRLTGGRIRGFALRVQRPAGPALTIRAGRCEIGARDLGRIVCRGDVAVQSSSGELVFDALAYDVGARAFATPDGGAPGAAPEERAAMRAQVAALNTAFRDLVPLPAATTVRAPHP